MKVRIKYRCPNCGSVYLWTDESSKKDELPCNICGALAKRFNGGDSITGAGKCSIDEFDIDRAVGRATVDKYKQLNLRESDKDQLRTTSKTNMLHREDIGKDETGEFIYKKEE